jgi:hypothetical protein
MKRHPLGVLLFASSMIACSTPQAVERSRPPSFEELERDLGWRGESTLRVQMWSLASDVRDLQAVFERGGGGTLEGRKEIAELLAQLENTAMRLDLKAHGMNHSDISLGAFRSEIRAARAGAERDPPDYYFAGRVAGSCAYCHR